MSYNGTFYYYLKDVFGNITHVYDRADTLMAYYKYDAWGNCTVIQDQNDVNNVANINPFRYRGYYYDVESGLYYLQSRYYSPEFRRFISPDSYDLIPTLAESGDLNLYVYCSNNPVMYTDPSGEFPLWAVALFGIFVSGVINGVVNVMTMSAGENAWGAFLGGFVEGSVSAAALAAGLAIGAYTGGVGHAILGGAISVTFGFIGGKYGNAISQKISYGNVDWGVANINGGFAALTNLFSYVGLYINRDILSTSSRLAIRFLDNIAPSTVGLGITVFFATLPKPNLNELRNEERIKTQKGKFLWEYLFK